MKGVVSGRVLGLVPWGLRCESRSCYEASAKILHRLLSNMGSIGSL